MYKRFIELIAFALLVTATGAAQSVGGGVSVWVPESLYLERGGSVSVETALGSSVGLGEFLSVPFGVVYNKVYGLLPEGAGLPTAPRTWFVADSFVLHASGMVTLPIGPVYIQGFGGGAVGWNATLVPLSGNIAADTAAAGEIVAFDTGAPTMTDGRLGYGWIAGGAVGVNLGQISVDLNATYRLLRYDVGLTGALYRLSADDGTLQATDSLSLPGLKLRLAGVAIGIDARFSF